MLAVQSPCSEILRSFGLDSGFDSFCHRQGVQGVQGVQRVQVSVRLDSRLYYLDWTQWGTSSD